MHHGRLVVGDVVGVAVALQRVDLALDGLGVRADRRRNLDADGEVAGSDAPSPGCCWRRSGRFGRARRGAGAGGVGAFIVVLSAVSATLRWRSGSSCRCRSGSGRAQRIGDPRCLTLQPPIHRRVQAIDLVRRTGSSCERSTPLHPHAVHLRLDLALAVQPDAAARPVAQALRAVHRAGHAVVVQHALRRSPGS